MSYLIDAWLEDGVPQLRICDAQTGKVCLRWARPRTPESAGVTPDCERVALQRLFRDLVLLSCTGKQAAVPSSPPMKCRKTRL